MTALDHADFDLLPGEILAVIGDNGAGKSTLIKALTGAVIARSRRDPARRQAGPFPLADGGAAAGIETVYQNLALSPALSIADNLFLGRERRKAGLLRPLVPQARPGRMQREAREQLNSLGLLTIQNISQPVETLSGGQRQGVAVARATAFGSRVVIMDEPTAALGVKESRKVLELILDVSARGLPIVLISHNMPHVFEVADRIHIHRLGRRIAVIGPKDHSMSDCGRDHDRRVGKVGDDPFGHFLAQTLAEAGVDTGPLRFTTQARTALAFVSLRADGEREFMFYRHPSGRHAVRARGGRRGGAPRRERAALRLDQPDQRAVAQRDAARDRAGPRGRLPDLLRPQSAARAMAEVGGARAGFARSHRAGAGGQDQRRRAAFSDGWTIPRRPASISGTTAWS